MNHCFSFDTVQLIFNSLIKMLCMFLFAVFFLVRLELWITPFNTTPVVFGDTAMFGPYLLDCRMQTEIRKAEGSVFVVFVSAVEH